MDGAIRELDATELDIVAGGSLWDVAKVWVGATLSAIGAGPIVAALGADAAGVTDSVLIFLGGPVSPNVAFALHSTEYHGSHTLDIDGHVALSDAAEVLRDLGVGHGPKQSLIAFGYAGWAPQQLDDELAHGAWIAAPENPALVFDTDRAKVWTDALALYKNEH